PKWGRGGGGPGRGAAAVFSTRANRATVKSRRDGMTIAQGQRGTSAALGYAVLRIIFLPLPGPARHSSERRRDARAGRGLGRGAVVPAPLSSARSSPSVPFLPSFPSPPCPTPSP